MRFDEFLSRNASPEEGRREPLTGQVIGAAIEVHREIGPGLTEAMYEDALCHEFDLRGIAYARQVKVTVKYKGKVIGDTRLDLVVSGRLVIELKSCENLTTVHRAQVICYLRATGYRHGLLINFNVAILKDGIKRLAHVS